VPCAIVDDGLRCVDRSSACEGVQDFVQVPGFGAGVSALSAGVVQTCAIKDGSLFCWGGNNNGQLGTGTVYECTTSKIPPYGSCQEYGANGPIGPIPDESTPRQVLGLVSGVSAVAAGADHTCAIVEGTALCWGYGGYGQLGSDKDSSPSPVQVQGLTDGVTAIAAGYYHTCAIVSGAARCWGSNQFGQLGDGTTINRSVPVQVQGLTSGVFAIAAAEYHTCAIVNDGIKCWGENGAGQLGNGTTLDSYIPVDVIGL